MNNEPRLTASLLSACPPDDAQQRRLEEVLAKKYGKPVSLTWQEDKTAAGGFRIRLGSEIIDWTAEGRLTQLKDKLASLRPGEGNVISLIRDINIASLSNQTAPIRFVYPSFERLI